MCGPESLPGAGARAGPKASPRHDTGIREVVSAAVDGQLSGDRTCSGSKKADGYARQREAGHLGKAITKPSDVKDPRHLHFKQDF